MPNKTLETRINRATANLSPRARVRQILRTIHAGDEATMNALCDGIPRKHYSCRDLAEMGALQASEHASLHLDRLAFRAMAYTFKGLVLEADTDNAQAAEAAGKSAGWHADYLATLAKAAKATAERLGLDVSEAFAYSMALDDRYFGALLETYEGTPDQADVERVTAELLAFWDGAENSLIRAA